VVVPESSPDGLSVVIPAWNEEDRLGPTLDRFLPVLESRGFQYEVLVVVDGVGDRTADVATLYADRNVKVLHFPTQLGKGGAIVEGVRAASFDKVGFLDADCPLAARDLEGLILHLGSADAAIASRWPPGGKPTFHDSGGRNFLSIAWSVLTRGLRLTDVRDAQCGAKFFHASPLREVIGRVRVRGWAFDLSLLYHWREAGLTCDEVDVDWSDSPGSKLLVRKAVPLMLFSLLGLRMVNSPAGRWFPAGVRGQVHRKMGRLAERFMHPTAESPPRPAAGPYPQSGPLQPPVAGSVRP
jgi:glycosyltransferase involved in cell wall biosynthesis